jgi:hypothetical protein
VINIEANKIRFNSLLREINRPGMPELISWLNSGTDFFTAPASAKQEYHLAEPGGLCQHSLNVMDGVIQKDAYFSFAVPGYERYEKDTLIIAGALHDVNKIGIYKEAELAKDRQLSWAKELLSKNLSRFSRKELDAIIAAELVIYPEDDKSIEIAETIPKEYAGIIISWLKNGYSQKDSLNFPPLGYGYNDDTFPLGHGEKSVIILQQFVKLQLPEILAIRWHMGPWDLSPNDGKWAFGEATKICPLVTMLQTADLEATHIIERKV